MPSVYVAQSDVKFEGISTTSTDGTEVDTPAFVVPVIIPVDQIPDWEAAYNPASSTSPSAADSRIIARAVLNAFKAAAETP